MKIYFEDITVNGSPLVWEVKKKKKRAECLNYSVLAPSIKRKYEFIAKIIEEFEVKNKNKNVSFYTNVNKGKIYINSPFGLDYTEIDSKQNSPKIAEERKVSFKKLVFEPSSENKRNRAHSTSSSTSPRSLNGSPLPSNRSYLSSEPATPRSDNFSHLHSPYTMYYTPTNSNRSLTDESPRTTSNIITPRSISSDSSPLTEIRLHSLITEKNSEAWRNTCAFEILYEKSVEKLNALKLPIVHNASSLKHISLCKITLEGHESKIKIFKHLVELMELLNQAYLLWFNKNNDLPVHGPLRNYLINAILDAMNISSRNKGIHTDSLGAERESYKAHAQAMLSKFRELLLVDKVTEEDDELYSVIIQLHHYFIAYSDDFVDQVKQKLTRVEEAVIDSLIVYVNSKQLNLNLNTTIDTTGFFSFNEILTKEGIKSSQIKNIISKSIIGLLSGHDIQNEEFLKYKYTPNLEIKDKDFYIAEEYRLPVENLIKQHFNKSKEKNDAYFKGPKGKKGSDFVNSFITYIIEEEIKKLKSIPEKEPEAMILHPSCHA